MMHTRMRFIGITGGVGAGKSELLGYLRELPNTRVMLADEIAHELMEPGTECYQALCEIFSQEEIWLPQGGFDRMKLAKVIFGDDRKRACLNQIVHPAVKEYVRGQVAYERGRGKLEWLFLEAALLIEEHYDEICDELWYIHTDESIRRERLKRARGYSDNKIDQIFASQMKDEEYRNACGVIIDNDGAIEKTIEQIEGALRRRADG